MKKFNWNDTWNLLLIIVASSALFLLVRMPLSDRTIKGYYLSSQGTGGTDTYQIMVDIDNNPDYAISVGRTISLDSTVTIIERLNRSIKK